MTLTFDRSVPVHIQRLRSAERKRVGHKHMHTIGPGKKQRVRPRANAHQKQQMRKFKQRVRAYYLGELDQYPQK